MRNGNNINYIDTITNIKVVQKINSCYYLPRSVVKSVIKLNATPSNS